MKKINLIYFCFLPVFLLMLSCKKQNLSETVGSLQAPKIYTHEYYANLRAYKKTKHQLAFGWFGNSGGDGKTSEMGLRWESIPDSTDIASCWRGLPPLGSPQFEAMQKVRQIKGTKVLMVKFSFDETLQYFGGEDFITKYAKGDEALLKKGFALVAKSMIDTINYYQIDGFDFDHEPKGILRDSKTFGLLIEEVSKYFGPKSGTDKLLFVDGEIGYLPAQYVDYIDYGVQQLYGVTSPANLEKYFFEASRKPANLPNSKIIIAESYEAEGGWQRGGPYPFIDPIRGTIPSILGYAYWQPSKGGRKGGAGAYHAEYEYNSPVPYKYFRQMIQIMNPAVK